MKSINEETVAGDIAPVTKKLDIVKRVSFRDFFNKSKKTKEANVLPKQTN
jgi:hypothetical protein